MQTIPVPRRRAHDASVAVWEDEGGATVANGALEATKAADRPVLEALGQAVAARWRELPTNAKRTLFETAASGRETSLKLARFLRARRNHAP